MNLIGWESNEHWTYIHCAQYQDSRFKILLSIYNTENLFSIGVTWDIRQKHGVMCWKPEGRQDSIKKKSMSRYGPPFFKIFFICTTPKLYI